MTPKKCSSVRYLDDGPYPAHIGILLSEGAYARACRNLDTDLGLPDWPGPCSAFTLCLESDESCLIWLAFNMEGVNRHSPDTGFQSIVVHEVSHAWTYINKAMNVAEEDNAEYRAYFLQWLYRSCIDAIREGWR